MKLTVNGCAFEKFDVNRVYKHIKYIIVKENVKIVNL